MSLQFSESSKSEQSNPLLVGEVINNSTTKPGEFGRTKKRAATKPATAIRTTGATAATTTAVRRRGAERATAESATIRQRGRAAKRPATTKQFTGRRGKGAASARTVAGTIRVRSGPTGGEDDAGTGAPTARLVETTGALPHLSPD